MKSLIVCVSKSHVSIPARSPSGWLRCLTPRSSNPSRLTPKRFASTTSSASDPEFISWRWTAGYRKLIRRLPRVDGIRAFTFFTSGAREVPLLDYNKPVRKHLESKGFEVIGSFSCRGFDTVGPFGFIGGINRGRPNDHDLDRAAAFAARLRERVGGSAAAS